MRVDSLYARKLSGLMTMVVILGKMIPCTIASEGRRRTTGAEGMMGSGRTWMVELVLNHWFCLQVRR